MHRHKQPGVYKPKSSGQIRFPNGDGLVKKQPKAKSVSRPFTTSKNLPNKARRKTVVQKKLRGK
jgi:hypothetical protein